MGVERGQRHERVVARRDLTGVRNENDPGGLEPRAGGEVMKPGPWRLLPGGQTFDEDVLCLSEPCVLLELCSSGAPDSSRMERWLSWFIWRHDRQSKHKRGGDVRGRVLMKDSNPHRLAHCFLRERGKRGRNWKKCYLL